MAKKCWYKYFLMKFFSREEKIKTREDKRMVKLDFFVFQNCLFGQILFKNWDIHVFGVWSFLLVHPSQGPMGFVICYFKEIGPWKLDHEVNPCKRPSSMV